MDTADQERDEAWFFQSLWRSLGNTSAPPSIELVGATGGLPSIYPVAALASASIGVATAAVAELLSLREEKPMRAIEVHRQHAAAAFRSERYMRPEGWSLPALWDPIAGDYPARDGFMRVHTNYANHRAAALRALGIDRASPTREGVAQAISRRDAEELELAIASEGGAAAKMRSAKEWSEHPQGRAVASEPLIGIQPNSFSCDSRPIPPLAAISRGETNASPLAKIRVLDLTRVIAGPVCTRVLAAYGADVLRLDPPGFEEVPALLADTTVGKRRAFLDLKAREGRELFERLIAEADLLICGYRANALESCGLGYRRLQSLNPALSIIALNAYGWTGPFRDRRGFDSLLQMSSGIAAQTMEALGEKRPMALPAQALDHASGYLLAAAACRALTNRLLYQRSASAHLSLARLSRLLTERGANGDPRAPEIHSAEPFLEREHSLFGPLQRVRIPGRVVGAEPRWARVSGPLGLDSPNWS